jgi:hypothetical protein
MLDIPPSLLYRFSVNQSMKHIKWIMKRELVLGVKLGFVEAVPNVEE